MNAQAVKKNARNGIMNKYFESMRAVGNTALILRRFCSYVIAKLKQETECEANSVLRAEFLESLVAVGRKITLDDRVSVVQQGGVQILLYHVLFGDAHIQVLARNALFLILCGDSAVDLSHQSASKSYIRLLMRALASATRTKPNQTFLLQEQILYVSKALLVSYPSSKLSIVELGSVPLLVNLLKSIANNIVQGASFVLKMIFADVDSASILPPLQLKLALPDMLVNEDNDLWMSALKALSRLDDGSSQLESATHDGPIATERGVESINDIVVYLLVLLRSGYPSSQMVAACCLPKLVGISNKGRELLIDELAIQSILDVLGKSSGQLLQELLNTLAVLARGSVKAREIICRFSGAMTISKMLKNARMVGGLKEVASNSIANIAWHHRANQNQFISSLGLSHLLTWLPSTPDSATVDNSHVPCVLRAIGSLVWQNTQGQKHIRTMEGIPRIVSILECASDFDVQREAAIVLGNCTRKSAANRLAVIEANGIPLILGLSSGSFPDGVRLEALRTLKYLVKQKEAQCLLVADPEKVSRLSPLLDARPALQIQAFAVLVHLSMHEDHQTAISMWGGIPRLTCLLSGKPLDLRVKALMLLVRADAQCCPRIQEEDLRIFMAHLRTLSGANQKKEWIKVITYLARCHDNHTIIVGKGLVADLYEAVSSPELWSPAIEALGLIAAANPRLLIGEETLASIVAVLVKSLMPNSLTPRDKLKIVDVLIPIALESSETRATIYEQRGVDALWDLSQLLDSPADEDGRKRVVNCINTVLQDTRDAQGAFNSDPVLFIARLETVLPEWKPLLSSLRSSVGRVVDRSRCSICMEHTVEWVITPCGHLLCEECKPRMAGRPCHVCRGRVGSFCRLYWSS